jgi:hypothetical protein
MKTLFLKGPQAASGTDLGMCEYSRVECKNVIRTKKKAAATAQNNR